MNRNWYTFILGVIIVLLINIACLVIFYKASDDSIKPFEIKEYENIIILKKGNSYELTKSNKHINVDWILIQDSIGKIRRVPCSDKMIFEWINEGDTIKNIEF